MKRLIIFLSTIGLFISMSAFGAAISSVPVNQLVTVPIQSNSGWHVGAEALYLKTSNSDLDYASVQTGGSAIPNGPAAKVDPGYRWGFGVDVGFHFAGTGNDLLAHYERLRSSGSDSIFDQNDILTRFIHPYYAGIYSEAHAKVKYSYDAADILLDQAVNIGYRLHTHLAAGVRCADLDSNMDARYYNPVEPSTDEAILKSSFKGIGPRFALNETYDLCKGLGIDAGIGTSLLIGSMKASNHQSISVSSVSVLLTRGAVRHIVPELDAKGGLSYSLMLGTGKLTIITGWKVINYFNAQDYMIYTDNSSYGNYINSMSSICFNGPYAGFVFKV
jgi:hypothetical protein